MDVAALIEVLKALPQGKPVKWFAYDTYLQQGPVYRDVDGATDQGDFIEIDLG